MKRLLLDQGLPRTAATLLRQSGWDVVHVSEIGMSRASDADIVQRGRAESRVCITLDADFHSLLATSGELGPSVIRIRKEGLDAGALAALLQGIWPRIEDTLRSGALVTITEQSVRVRGAADRQALTLYPGWRSPAQHSCYADLRHSVIARQAPSCLA